MAGGELEGWIWYLGMRLHPKIGTKEPNPDRRLFGNAGVCGRCCESMQKEVLNDNPWRRSCSLSAPLANRFHGICPALCAGPACTRSRHLYRLERPFKMFLLSPFKIHVTEAGPTSPRRPWVTASSCQGPTSGEWGGREKSVIPKCLASGF